MKTAHTHIFRSRRSGWIVLLAGVLSVWTLPALAQTARQRLSDKDVKALIEQVDQERDKFEGNLDSKLKGAVLRSETVDISVSAALQDYQDNVKKLKDRFTTDYSASAEVQTVLKNAKRFENFLKASPDVTKGRSEWDREVASLKQLAAAYGTTFPMPDGATVRRMNDKEAADAADAIAKSAGRVKSDFDKLPATALAKTDKDAITKNLDTLIKSAELVKSRLNDGKPATAEVQELMTHVAAVQKFMDGHPTPSASANWEALGASLAKVQQAFELN